MSEQFWLFPEMHFTFEHRGYRITVHHGGMLPAGLRDPRDLKRVTGQASYEGNRASVWVASDISPGSPSFYGVLAHELVHLAGYLLDPGESRDPRDEDLPEMLHDLTKAVFEHLSAVGFQWAADESEF